MKRQPGGSSRLSANFLPKRQSYQQAVFRLTTQMEQVKRRLNQACLDKLDGKITE